MSESINISEIRKNSPFWLIAFWSVLLLVIFVPTIPQPSSIIGYVWQVEFALAGFIFLTLCAALVFYRNDIRLVRISRLEFFAVIFPLVLFTVWSGLSLTWAQTPRAALHHTLLWACYTLFYILVRQIVSKPQLILFSFKVMGIVVLILGAACLIQYVGSVKPITQVFTYRYYKFAEAVLTLLPLFFALSLRGKNKSSIYYTIFAVFGWLLIILSLSRTMFIAGVFCVFLFFGSVFFVYGKKYLKKSFVIIFLLIFLTGLTQVSFLPGEEKNTFSRITKSNKFDQKSKNVRYLYWGIALETFKSNPLKGVGADNFVSVYKSGRENYSALDTENKLLEIDREVLPERAHNEFLQILSELGAVGFALFFWLLIGIVYLFLSIKKERRSLLTLASFAGIAGFLVCSLASAYSFRVAANGLCFFFMLALGAQGLVRKDSGDDSKGKSYLITFGLIICLAMLVFSGVRGWSLMYLAKAQSTSDQTEAENYLQKAIALDSRDAMFRFYYGARLYNQKRFDESLLHLRFAKDNGIANSPNYYLLLTAQVLSGNNAEAETTFRESLRVFPRSVFLRTAFASYLEKNGKQAEADIEYRKALEINPRQAQSWYLAHSKGLEKLGFLRLTDEELLEVGELLPQQAVLTLMNYEIVSKEYK